MKRRLSVALLAAGLFLGTAGALAAPAGATSRGFVIEETTVARIHAAFARGELTCVQLVRGFLARIEAYEDHGPAINSLITLAPDVLAQARALDRKFRDQHGKVEPLHCIPVILKDNIDTRDMQTTAGTMALLGFVPSSDAFQVRKLREAGAVIIGKSNLHELASGITTVGSARTEIVASRLAPRPPNAEPVSIAASSAMNFPSASR